MDEIEEWTAAQRRVTELMTGLDAVRAAEPVPVCPDWTVRNLLSHLIGLDADVLGGDEPDDHHSEWTQAQVEAHADRTVPELLAEWAGLVTPLREWMRRNTTRPLGDVIIHEQDLRGALRRPGAQDTAGPAMPRELFSGRFAEAVAELPPPALSWPGVRWPSCAAGPPRRHDAVSRRLRHAGPALRHRSRRIAPPGAGKLFTVPEPEAK